METFLKESFSEWYFKEFGGLASSILPAGAMCCLSNTSDSSSCFSSCCCLRRVCVSTWHRAEPLLEEDAASLIWLNCKLLWPPKRTCHGLTDVLLTISLPLPSWFCLSRHIKPTDCGLWKYLWMLWNAPEIKAATFYLPWCQTPVVFTLCLSLHLQITGGRQISVRGNYKYTIYCINTLLLFINITILLSQCSTFYLCF